MPHITPADYRVSVVWKRKSRVRDFAEFQGAHTLQGDCEEEHVPFELDGRAYFALQLEG